MSLRPRAVDFDETWGRLQKIVEKIMLEENVTKDTWQDSFSYVYTLCTAYGVDGLFERTYQQTQKFLECHVDRIKTEIQTSDKLHAYQQQWSKYYRGSTYLNFIYGYMNKHHISTNKFNHADHKFGIESNDKKPTLKEISEMALDVWKTRLLEPLSAELVLLLMDSIRNERLGTLQRGSVIHDVIESFVQVDQFLSEKYQLGTYKIHIEKRYLEDTEDYYREEAAKLRASHSCSEYMVLALERLTEEVRRCKNYLHRSSVEAVADKCSAQLVTQHLDFLQSETVPILKGGRYHDLQNMYRLFKPFKVAVEPLNEAVYAFIKEKGIAKLKALYQTPSEQQQPGADNTLAKQFVEAVLEVHGHFSGLIRDHLDSDQQFLASLDKAFMVIVNHKEDGSKNSRASELLAKYCDLLLKKGKMSDHEIDEKLALAITVLKYIEEQDVFQKFYQRNLARRLIHNQSNSMDCEESMIKQLKVACGFDFINKLNRMFTDIGVSGDLNQKFNDYLSDNSTELGFGLQIHVLSAGFWPLGNTPSVSVIIPDEIQRCVNLFKEFYDKKFNGRRLLWLHSLCYVDVKMNGFKKPYIGNMTTYHLAVLSLFNRYEKLTVGEIQTATDITFDTLQKVIESMTINMKVLKLDSTTNAKEVKAEDTVRVNDDFNHKLIKFKIPLVLAKETEKEVQQTRNSVDEDRRMFLQAAIVRIMKSRKQMRHNDLVQEVVKQSVSRFVPNFTMIKRAIEGLIEKAYLERSPSSSDEYLYVA